MRLALICFMLLQVSMLCGQSRDSLVLILPGHQIRFGGYAQLRYQSFQETGKADYADIRRARVDMKGNTDRHWNYRLQCDLAGNPKLLDLYIGYKPVEYIMIQAGQFKLPFSKNNLTASNTLDMIDRALVVEALVARNKDVIGNQNGRDIGLQFSGSFFTHNEVPMIELLAGIFNGNGINTGDNNEPKDLAGRIVLHPAKNLETGISYYNGYSKIEHAQNGTVRKRSGCEISYIYKFVSVSGEYIMGNDGVMEKEGWYGRLTSFIREKRLQLTLQYDYYDNNRKLSKDESIYITAGMNCFFNANTRAAVNYSRRNETGAPVNNDLISVQLQVSY